MAKPPIPAPGSPGPPACAPGVPTPAVPERSGSAPAVPERIGPWTVERLLGRGAVGSVYLGHDGGGRIAAIKWLHRAGPGERRRLQEEVECLRTLPHPQIVGYLGEGSWEERPYIAMDYLPGPDLQELGARLRRLPPAERQQRVQEIGLQLCRVLGWLHAQGVVHRDVKPRNLMMGQKGEVVLGDFGIAGREGEPGVVGGTAGYAGPEQLQGGAVDPRSDQFGLGGTLWFLLTGRRPEKGPPSLVDPTVTAAFDGVVERLRAALPEGRFGDMAAATAALRALPSVGRAVAGREEAIRAVAAALERVEAGETVVLQVEGERGSGRRWIRNLALEAAWRRGLRAGDPAAAAGGSATGSGKEGSGRDGSGKEGPDVPGAPPENAQLQLFPGLHPTDPAPIPLVPDGSPALLVTTRPHPGARVVPLLPLTVAEVRRTLHAVAPRTPLLAAVSVAVHGWTGGNVALLTRYLAVASQDEGVLPPGEAPEMDLGSWLEGLSEGELQVGSVVALFPGPVGAEVVEAVVGEVQGPGGGEVQGSGEGASGEGAVGRSLGVLLAQGVLRRKGERYGLVGEVLREALLGRCPRRGELERIVAERYRMEPPEDPLLEEIRKRKETRGSRASLLQRRLDDDTPDDDRRAARLLLLADLYLQCDEAELAEGASAEAAAIATLPALKARSAVAVGMAALHRGRVAAARGAFGEGEELARRVGDPVTEGWAGVNGAAARGLAGDLPGALREVRESRERGGGNLAVAALALRVEGTLLLDLGRAGEALEVLADATAVAHAAGLSEDRHAAHVLRAIATLEERPEDPAAAAAALDRLSKVLLAKVLPGAPDVLGQAAWAWAAAALGDRPRYLRAAAAAEAGMGRQPLAVRLRTQLLLARAAVAAGEPKVAEGWRERVGRAARESGMGVWAGRET